MLRSVNLDDKSYEELMDEAIGRIPLYSAEWTNFNRSDPGITMLQNLTAFNHLQQMQLNEVSEAVRLRLLGLLGYHRGQNRASRVYLQATGRREALTLPVHTAFMAGGLQFETTAETHLAPWCIEKALAIENGTARDITHLLGQDVSAGAALFGRNPAPGAQLYLFLGGMPGDGVLHFWAEVEASSLRNPQHDDCPVELADLRWEIYTIAGWRPVAAQDETWAFMQSGAITLPLPTEPPALYDSTLGTGYAVRCTLLRAGYDLPVRLQSMAGNLFKVSQRRTCAAVFHLDGAPQVTLNSRLAARGNLFVYCREEHAASPYRAYRQVSDDVELTGRYFCVDIDHDGTVAVRFDHKKFGYSPAAVPGAVMVVCYDDSTVLNRALGQVYGYEDQVFELEHLDNVLPEGFCLLAEETDGEGEHYYYLVEPGNRQDPDTMYYTLQSRAGTVTVHRPAISGTCYLYLAGCAVTQGAEGMVRGGNQFVTNAPGTKGVRFSNPGPGYGGASEETSEMLRRRFIHDMRTPDTAVTAGDYEALAACTPGLCIHKTKALADEARNLVRVAVKPHAPEAYPRLTELYAEHITAWLEQRRLVNTRIELVQPVYVPIDVKASVEVRSTAGDARGEIERLLRHELDFAAIGRGFGETVRYHELFHKLEQLPSVSAVLSLALIPQSRADAAMEGPDIRLNFNCFARPGQMLLELGVAQ